MSARVTQGISERAVQQEDTTAFLNREAVPALKQARAAINARFGQDATIVTASRDVTLLDEVLLVDATDGPITVTLLVAAESTRELTVIKIDASANAVTVAAQTGQTISGSATHALAAQWDFVKVQAAEVDG